MARVPKFLAEFAERRGFTTRVHEVDRPSAGLVRITFEGDSLRERTLTPGDVTSFRISATDFRHYTPETLDAANGRAAILFHDHGVVGSPGWDLVSGLTPGDELRWCGWASAKNFRWTSPKTALAMGDASALGLLVSMRDRAAEEGRRLLAVAEVEPGDCAYAQELLPEAVVVPAAGEHGDASVAWLDSAEAELRDLDPACVYLAGHAGSIQRQRSSLRDRHGLDRKRIRTQPYWATGKVGL